MLIALSIVPIGGDRKTSGELAEVLKIIDQAGLSYQLTRNVASLEEKSGRKPERRNKS